MDSHAGPQSARRLVYRGNLILALASGMTIVVLALITLYEVVRRYVLNMPTGWTMEVSEILIIAAAFLAMSFTLQLRAHVKVDVLYVRYRSPQKRAADLLASVFALAFWTILTWKATQQALHYVLNNVRSETLLAIPRFIPMSLVLVGSLFCGVQAVVMVYDAVVSLGVRRKTSEIDSTLPAQGKQ